MTNRLVTIAMLLGFSALASRPANAQDAPTAPPFPQLVLEGHSLRVVNGSSEAVVDLGCEGRVSLRSGNSLFVACGTGGVVEVDLSNPIAPHRIGRMPVDGEATGLVLRDGRVWVDIAHFDTRPVNTGPPVPSPVQITPGSPPPIPTPVMGGIPSGGPPETKRSLMAPPRRGGLWELSAMAGAFVNFGPLGGGATGWASAVYRFDAPFVVRAELAPLGLAIGQTVGETLAPTQTGFDNSTRVMTVAAAHLLAGLDTQFVELAVGGGAASTSTSYDTTTAMPATAGVSIVEEGRLGARDGLALNIESVVVGANNRFEFASLATSVQVPVTPTIMLMVRGGGGGVGVFYGDLGARVIVRGDGGHDTIALTGFFGGAGIDFQSCYSTAPPNVYYGSTCRNYTSLGGPSIGGGVEWRQ